jgi:2-keto-4-pentenoate hydratase/2-oxohepta-3-ene-1,7-dioic acid hydratase in catechol pathway
VTGDELDPEELELSCWVNDELRQKANTRDLILDIRTNIETGSSSHPHKSVEAIGDCRFQSKRRF